MIGYITLGTNDISRAASFYDALLALLGATRTMEAEDFIVWGKSPSDPMFSIHKPFDKNPASVGNGVMIALRAENVEQVTHIHSKALELGGTDEGKPGPRAEGFHASYFRDLDGNKLNAFYMG